MSEITPVIELELYFARHGQSYGNIGESNDDDLRDSQDPELTETGRNQARLLGERFARLPLDALFSSGLVRAISTAAEVAKRQPQNGAHEIEVFPVLSENRMKEEYLGIEACELKERFPYAHISPDVLPGSRLVISCLTDEENYKRAMSLHTYLRNRFKNGEKVLMVGHAAFNTSLLFALLARSIDGVKFDPNFANTGLSKIIYYKQGTGPFGDDIRLSYCNDMSHLFSDYPTLGFEI